MCRGAGVSLVPMQEGPAFLRRVEIGKTAGKMPAPQEKPAFLDASCLGFQREG
jgi:hypothetical protein